MHGEGASVAYRAAWMPFHDPARPVDPTPAAVRWLVRQAEQLHLKLTLLSGQPLAGRLPPAMRYVREWERHMGARRAQGRAVLLYLPTAATAARAFRAARGGAVAVVEGPELPLIGWAAEVGATNLLTGRPQESLGTDTDGGIVPLLDLLADGEMGAQLADEAIVILRRTSARLPANHLAGCLLAHGHGARTVRRVLEWQRRASVAAG